MRSARTPVLVAMLAVAGAAFPASAHGAQPELVGRAVLPADTFAAGPPSGAALAPGPHNGRQVPFSSQPVQGLSAVLDAGGGAFWALPDNGYGSKNSSYDFLLRLYRIRPDFKTAGGGSGSVTVEGFIELRDPDGKIGFPIRNGATPERLLTGADFDPESVRRGASGDLWFGDEFGPFLLHTDATGRLEEAPIPLPGVKSPQNPTLASGEASTLGSSDGFEAMALSTEAPSGCAPPATGAPEVLHPVLEDALIADPDRQRRYLYSFALAEGRYGPERWQYRTEHDSHKVADMASVDRYRLLVLERDNRRGAGAAFKRVYLVDLRETDADGFLVKRLVADLLTLRDPQGVSLPGMPGDIGLGDPFRFSYGNVESLLPVSRDRLIVINDNNYPFDTGGRNPDRLDDNEVIEIAVDAMCERVEPPPDPDPDRGPPPEPDPDPQPTTGGSTGPVPPLVALLPDRTAPRISRFGVTRRRFRVGARPTRVSAVRRGTVFRFRVSEPATMRLTLRRGSRRVGSLVTPRPGGPGAIRFTGRIGRRAPAPGRYRATLGARDAAGNPARPRTLRLRILR